MKCPIDTTVDLRITERSGIEIDYCPSCRGVWLDRGELDKLLERAAAPARDDHRGRGPDRRGDDDGLRDHPKGKRKKRSSLLEELFDF